MSKPIDPAQYAMSGTEDAAQIALFIWSSQVEVIEAYPDIRWMFAIPNGGFRTKAGAGKLRAMGLKKGIPDIFLPVKRGPWNGLFIELKREKRDEKRAGQASPDQKKWIEALREQGFGAMVCVGYEQARETIIKYLEWKEE